MNIIEDILQIKERSLMGKITNKKTIWIKVAPFWQKTTLRKSIFTAFLRTGSIYHGDFQDANHNSEYFFQVL